MTTNTTKTQIIQLNELGNKMNLDKTYRVTLQDKKDKEFVQYIEAENVDSAIKSARNSFSSRVYGLDKSGALTQKSCKLTILTGKLRFCFDAGWITLDVTGLNIFEALKKAETHHFTEGKKITEIQSSPSFN